jgi:hypothetical protein
VRMWSYRFVWGPKVPVEKPTRHTYWSGPGTPQALWSRWVLWLTLFNTDTPWIQLYRREPGEVRRVFTFPRGIKQWEEL